jgi:hypothetical protein
MAQKGGKVRRVFMIVLLLSLSVITFILLGGGDLLKSAGNWIGGVGKKADDVKQTIEQKATTIEKTVEKLKEGEKSGEKK